MAKQKPYRYLLYLLLLLFEKLSCWLPRRLMLGVAGGVGMFAWWALPRERQKVIRHLTLAFGESKSDGEYHRIGRWVFENLGQTAVDTLRISNMTRGDFDRLVQEEGVFSKIEQALERGKGLIFVTAHLGNWELITHVIGAHGYKGGVIGRRIYYEPFNRVLERIRRLSGAVIIYRDESPRSVLQILRKNQVIGMLPDQDVDNIEGIFIPFFGKDAYTLTAPAKFAYASGAPILPVFMVREGLRYRLVADELLWSNHQNEREKEIERLTTAWSQVFESMIRRYPEQWVWMHRRWKTQPAKMSHSEVING